MNEITRPCPRCEAKIFTMEKISAIAAEIKIDPALAAEDRLFEKRVNTCGECEALREKVMCAHCGCFVLFRARSVKSYCPHPKGDRWACQLL
jgi:hypothetical protein